MITESARGTLRAIRARTHPNCIVCGRANGRGPQLDFCTCADGSVQATFDCKDSYKGYANVVHGGVVYVAGQLPVLEALLAAFDGSLPT